MKRVKEYIELTPDEYDSLINDRKNSLYLSIIIQEATEIITNATKTDRKSKALRECLSLLKSVNHINGDDVLLYRIKKDYRPLEIDVNRNKQELNIIKLKTNP